MLFIAIPEIPCPVERDTIISKGKWVTRLKKPPEHKALINPSNITKTHVKNLFKKESISKSIVNRGIKIRKEMESTIPIITAIINWIFKGIRFFFHSNANWKIIIGA